MAARQVGPLAVQPLGLGCMGFSHGYGPTVAEDQAVSVLDEAFDRGINFFDTAALYGNGANEQLLGRWMGARRHHLVLASKCGLHHPQSQAERRIDGRPESIRASCEASLQRLGTDVIDLLYLHRLDRGVPIEDSVGAMSDLVRAGKARAIGLSEVSATTLRRAHATHPIAAVQSEYSLWTRNPEIAVLSACESLGIALVAFSPLGRAYLTAKLVDPSRLHEGDIRRTMPRFDLMNYAANLRLLDRLLPLAEEAVCTPAQLALAWLLHKSPCVVPIPGTTNPAHLVENLGAQAVVLGPDLLARLERLFNPDAVCGPRYNATSSAEVDTEQFDS